MAAEVKAILEGPLPGGSLLGMDRDGRYGCWRSFGSVGAMWPGDLVALIGGAYAIALLAKTPRMKPPANVALLSPGTRLALS